MGPFPGVRKSPAGPAGALPGFAIGLRAAGLVDLAGEKRSHSGLLLRGRDGRENFRVLLSGVSKRLLRYFLVCVAGDRRVAVHSKFPTF